MSPHPFAPWLDLLRSTLPVIEQARQQAPAAQAQWAGQIKSALELNKACNAARGATAFALLQAQLSMLGTPAPARAAQGLFDIQFDAMSQLFMQWKALSDQLGARTGACVAALRDAAVPDDLTFVVAGFMRDTGSALDKAAGEAALLVQSASAAADVLTLRMLDEMSAPPDEMSAPQAQT